MNVLEYWVGKFGAVPEFETAAEARQQLMVAASDLAGVLGTTEQGTARLKYRHEDWKAVGVDPVQAHISSDGAAYRRGETLRVVVNVNRPELRQRYTIAHELGHCLLRQLMERNRELCFSGRDEEQLCDLFASQVLVPDSRVLGLVGDLQSPPAGKEVLEWCKALQINIEPMLIALKRHWRWEGSAVVYCQHYAHRRSSDPALRVVSYASDRQMYLPRHKRVVSLGLHGVVQWFEESRIAVGSGFAERGRVPLYVKDTEARSGWLQGPVDWAAMRLNDGSQGSGRVILSIAFSARRDLRWSRSKSEDGVALPSDKGG